ncbi:hypothetical protein [Fimbriiglobus ruber]|uniref:Mobile element protein n=1 Tax=Fimbriiglobus ruber TaxID=1908690 RepID=A0A225D0K2_9BACT|nr:hypothetical protein [Fimbriiglobus ruber]OWK34463.1 hypothetical protein FRUB_10434 [Fimbriiglobus ruber]
MVDDVALNVLAHLADGCGVRQTGRLVGVTKDTAARYAAHVWSLKEWVTRPGVQR